MRNPLYRNGLARPVWVSEINPLLPLVSGDPTLYIVGEVRRDTPRNGDREMATMTLYHGSHKHTEGLVLHEGICLTEWEDVAEKYAGNGGATYEIEMAMDGLTILDAPGYDHDTNDCPADHADYRAARAAEGADVLRYDDEDERGEVTTCYRLVSEAAIHAVRVTAAV
jgi:hypothetical protein